MTSVLTLITDPANPVLDPATAAHAASFLPGPGTISWLAPGIAADVPFDGEPADGPALAARIRKALDGRPVDVAIRPAAHRRKRLLVADMDSTIIGQECIDELADRVGLKPRISAITERAMRGEIAFEPALRERVALLAGLPETVVTEVLAERVRLTPGATTLVRTMRGHGAYTALVSGGFTLFAGPVAEMAGFDQHSANRLVVENGRLAGTVVEPVLGREAKLATLTGLTAELGIAAAETMAVGDGANDLAMIAAAGLGVAYHAKPVVAEAAPVRIDHGDLTALLYLQGYPREAFAG